VVNADLTGKSIQILCMHEFNNGKKEMRSFNKRKYFDISFSEEIPLFSLYGD